MKKMTWVVFGSLLAGAGVGSIGAVLCMLRWQAWQEAQCEAGRQAYVREVTRAEVLPPPKEILASGAGEEAAEVEKQALRVRKNQFDGTEPSLQFDFEPKLDVHASLPKRLPEFEPKVADMTMRVNPSGQLVVAGAFASETVYAVTFPAGFRDVRGMVSSEPIVCTVKTGEVAPLLKLQSAGIYLPLHRAVLPIAARNMSAIRVELSRAYENNLTPLGFGSWEADQLMQAVTQAEERLDVPRDVETVHELDIGKLAGQRPGLYRVEVSGKGSEQAERCVREAYVVLTDLGVAYVHDGHDGFRVAVRSLATGAPVPQAYVEVADAKNQPMFHGTTGPDGLAALRLIPISAPGEVLRQPAKLLVRTKTDFTYVELEDTRHHGDVDEPPGGKRPVAFLWCDRAAVRPGEQVRIYGVAVDAELNILPQVPISFQARFDDDAKTVLANAEVITDSAGMVWQDVCLPKEAKTGWYRATLTLGKTELGSATFYVSDFVPDRFKLSAAVTSENRVNVSAKTFFGTALPEAFGSVRVFYQAAALPEAWRKWQVGVPGKVVSGELLDERLELKQQVSAEIPFSLPKKRFNQPLQVMAKVELAEPNARVVTAYAGDVRFTESAYVGLRSEEDALPEATLLVPEGAPEREAKAVLSLEQITWNYAISVRTGREICTWQELANPVVLEREQVVLRAGEVCRPLPEGLPEGHYRLTAALESGVTTTHDFWYFQGEAGRRSVNPAVLAFETDRAVYHPGETARLTFRVPAEGTLLIAEGGQALRDFRTQVVKGGVCTVSTVIPQRLRTGSWHVGITFIPYGEASLGRTFGCASLRVEQTPVHGLRVALQTPQWVRPGASAEVTLRLTTPQGKPCGGEVMFFAVDEGVLVLTDYQTPNPLTAFFGPKKSPFTFGDVYGLLYPRLRIGADGRIGGDGIGHRYEALRRADTARIVLPPQTIPESGEARISLKIPMDFQGVLRVMAVAVSPKTGRMGAADCSLPVRPAATLQGSGIRYGCPGDAAEVVLTITNYDVPEEVFTLTVGAETVTGTLARGTATNRTFRLPAETVRAVLKMGDEQVTAEFPVKVRSPIPETRMVVFKRLPEGEEIPANATAVNALTEAAQASLDWLAGYRYICTEQLSARALPYCFRKDRQAQAVLANVARQLLMRWQPAGGFTAWPKGSLIWRQATPLAAGVILAAFRTGALPENQAWRDTLLRHLRTLAMNGTAEARGEAAYAVWLLALEEDDTFRKAAQNLLAADRRDMAAFLAAAALVRGGYAAEGVSTLRALLRAEDVPEKTVLDPFMDRTASLGMMTAVAAACGMGKDVPAEWIGRLLMAPKNGTQANAWAAAALQLLDGAFPPGRLIRQELCLPAIRPGQLIAVQRQILNARGFPVTLLKHGELAYIQISFTLPKPVFSLAVCDLLPGGLEVEDGALATRSREALPAWADAENHFQPEYREQLGDEVRFFGSADAGTSRIVYPVRAVARGRFRVPATLVEGMTEPDLTGGFAPDKELIID